MKWLFFIVGAILAWGLFNVFVAGGGNQVGNPLPVVPLLYNGVKQETKGRPMVLEYWATWCPPCRQSIPHLNELYAKYKNSGVVFLGVTEESLSVIRDFQKNVPMHYSTASDTKGILAKKLGIRGIPRAFLVDKNGMIVWEGHPMLLTSELISKHLKVKAS